MWNIPRNTLVEVMTWMLCKEYCKEEKEEKQ